MKRLATVLNHIVFWGLLLVIPLAVIPYGTVDAWWEAAFECAIFSLTVLWILEGLMSGNWEMKSLSVLAPLIAITAYAFLQAVHWPPARFSTAGGQHMISIDGYQTYLTARKSLALLLFIGALLVHTSTRERLRWAVRVVIAIGLASAVFGILRQFLQPSDSTRGFILPFLFPTVGYGQFISANAFAYLMEMSLGLVTGLLFGGGINRQRVPIYVAVMAVIWTALVLSNSRGGLISLACQSVFVLFVALSWYSERNTGGDRPNKALIFLGRSKLVRALAVILILGTLTAGVAWMGGDDLANKLAARDQSGQNNPDGTTRQEIWHSSWKLIKQHPWTGVGFGAYFLAISQYQAGSGSVKLAQAHNDYLDLAANGGLIAVGLALWFIILVIRRVRSSLGSRDYYRRAVALGAAAGTLAVGVHSVVDFGLQVTGNAVVFAALIVFLISPSLVETGMHRTARRLRFSRDH